MLEAIVAERGWAWGKGLVLRLYSGRIRITSPRPHEILQDPQPLGDSAVSFAVHGTLRRLPKDFHIWLLTQDERGRVRPQGFSPIVPDPLDKRRWSGRVNAGHVGGSRAKIIAVVAPPTSHDFFTYYQTHGHQTGYAWLERVPAECRNQAFVDALLPPTLNIPTTVTTRQQASNIRVVHIAVEYNPTWEGYPLKCYVTFQNNASGTIEVNLYDYTPRYVTLKQFVPEVLQVRLRDKWYPRPDGVDRVALLPTQLCRAWIGLDEKKFDKNQVEKSLAHIGTLVFTINGERQSIDL